MRDEEKFMKEAIRQAKKAYALREVPIGCVIVYEGKILPVVTIGEIQIKIPLLMRKSMQFEKQVKN